MLPSPSLLLGCSLLYISQAIEIRHCGSSCSLVFVPLSSRWPAICHPRARRPWHTLGRVRVRRCTSATETRSPDTCKSAAAAARGRPRAWPPQSRSLLPLPPPQVMVTAEVTVARMHRTSANAPTSRSQLARLHFQAARAQRPYASPDAPAGPWKCIPIRPRIAGVGGSALKRGLGSRCR